MPIVTLTTDWGNADFYVAALKGVLLKSCMPLTLVDLSHELVRNDVQQASFILDNAYSYFPPKSIHVLAVQDGVGDMVLVDANEHFFIASNNGCLSFLSPEQIRAAVRLDLPKDTPPTLRFTSIVPIVVAALAKSEDIHTLGNALELVRYTPMQPILHGLVLSSSGDYLAESIVGHILHFDAGGNAITNISKALFEKHCSQRSFTVNINSNRYQTSRICNTYQDEDAGEIFALFNAHQMLEVGMVEGNARELYRLNIRSTVMIRFTH
ncbi:MAG: SAM hydrolase/SAM-dependent halogenase family protein [Bacteroidales bacterium]